MKTTHQEQQYLSTRQSAKMLQVSLRYRPKNGRGRRFNCLEDPRWAPTYLGDVPQSTTEAT
jgi:hypothetical protein